LIDLVSFVFSVTLWGRQGLSGKSSALARVGGTLMSAGAWYVIQSKPRKESQVIAYLKSQGLEVYFPTVAVQRANPRAATAWPLFPCYLFVRANIDKVGVSALQWVPGAIGLVEFDGKPATVHPAVIGAIRQRVRSVQAASGSLLGVPTQDETDPNAYDLLAGYEALFDPQLSGVERTQALLKMLSRRKRRRGRRRRNRAG